MQLENIGHIKTHHWSITKLTLALLTQ